MNIEEFKKKNKPKRTSNLKKFESEISELISSGYSQVSICEFLISNGVKTTQQNVSRFCKKISSNFKPVAKEQKKEMSEEASFSGFKLERKGKDLEIKAAPDWATQ